MKNKRYLEYKDSRYEWLGEIPLHWELKRAKWGFKEKSIKGYPEEILLSVSKGKGVIPRSELENQTVMAFKDLENFKLVVPEDFVIHLRSFQSGFEMSTNQGIVSPAYTVFSCRGNLSPRYYKFLFYMQSFIDAIASTTQSLRDGKPIAYKDFSNMELPYPSYSEQIKIAGFLEVKLAEIDKLITMKEKLILLLNNRRQSIITEAVTKGLNRNVKMKASGVEWIGEIPEHWGKTKLKFICEMKSGNSIDSVNINKSGTYSVYGGGELRGYTENYTHNGEYVIVGRQGANCGQATYVSGKFWATEHAVVVTTKKVNIKWLYYVLKSMNLNQYSIAAAQPGIAVSTVLNLIIPQPLLKEQIEIMNYLTKYDVEVSIVIEDIKTQIKKLKEYRQSLIYEAVTGKIDVRDMELD